MNKEQYRVARAKVRANGMYAYRWIPREAAIALHALAEPTEDHLRDRAEYASYRERAPYHASRAPLVRLCPCPSQRSESHSAALARTLAKHWEHIAHLLA